MVTRQAPYPAAIDPEPSTIRDRQYSKTYIKTAREDTTQLISPMDKRCYARPSCARTDYTPHMHPFATSLFHRMVVRGHQARNDHARSLGQHELPGVHVISVSVSVTLPVLSPMLAARVSACTCPLYTPRSPTPNPPWYPNQTCRPQCGPRANKTASCHPYQPTESAAAARQPYRRKT